MEVDLSKFNDALTEHVRLDSFPVAVRMVKPGEQLPERLKRPRSQNQSRHLSGHSHGPPLWLGCGCG